jgi:LCP family protein required for cell wall assembly
MSWEKGFYCEMNRNKLKIVGQIALVVVAIALVYVVIMLIDDRIGIFDSDEDYDYYEEELPITIGDQEYELAHEVSSYLIMGTDESGKEELERTNYEGSMADFLLVLMVDDTDESYGFIEINRDTISEVPLLLKDGTDYASADMQLCVAHAYGGSKRESCENTVKAVSGFLRNIPFDGYYALKMEAIPELNHAVGGVTVTIEDDFSSVDSAMEEGKTITLTDEQAYTFLHARQGLGDGENTSRMRRQRAYMDALMEQVKEKAASSKKFVSKVYDSLSYYATTDMGSKTVTNLAQKLTSYTSKGTVSPEGESKVGTILGDGIEHSEFYVDEDALDELIMDMYPLQEAEEE